LLAKGHYDLNVTPIGADGALGVSQGVRGCVEADASTNN
jgi:hypothetical protein